MSERNVVFTVPRAKAAWCNTLPSTYRGDDFRESGGSIDTRSPGTEPNESGPARRADGHETGTDGASQQDHGADAASHVRILASGVDNVYASVACDIAPAALTQLAAARTRAEQAGDAEPIEIAGRTFLVAPRSSRGYTIRLQSPVMDVWAQCEGKSERPPLLIELRSLGIHITGVEALVEEAHQVAAWCCPPLAGLAPGDGMKVSRIDLYCDLQGWAPTNDDNERWVGRPRLVGNRDDRESDGLEVRSRHRRGRTFSGFTFGRGRVAARVYNKTLLMASKREDWMTTIWNDRVPGEAVWRVEVQLRRGVLRDFCMGDDGGEQLSSVRDALAERQALWHYGVGEWLTLRQPRDLDSNKWRWPIDPVWRVVQDATIGSPCSPLVRVKHAAAAHERLVQGMTGYVTSLLAHEDANFLRATITVVDAAMATGTNEDRERAVRMALEGMAPAITEYCDRKHRRFLGIVDGKRRKNGVA